ncbi:MULTISPECIES: DUF6246 family protein [Pantoea]|jgi:hypothetical protein|uniref:DUF6246 family protein n=1 Tax=Pantoea TaxID=53335 RepID=UPI000EA059A5|nr:MULTISPECIES: DUF6246 family protein [Pantoea]MBZ6385536.1 DUF6246 family protein [Pantoea piersonii]MBZ6398920.1 DUF6246 family protein [Pantoea piersonii]MBZ6407582.1 DUF6246 family protein [Pantoea piersonii]MBZ6425467.1 DUF6246 family protein [Pantoea piersonii]NYB01010.1 hypothetical protein [Pantoea piersonii]
MTPLKEIGECLISAGDSEYFFRPSLINMTRIGDPADIVQALYDLHNDEASEMVRQAISAYGEVPAWLAAHLSAPQYGRKAIIAAMTVLQSCCARDASPLTGEIIPGRSGKWAFVYRKGKMTTAEMIIIARSLIVHGVIGKAKVRRLQKHEGTSASSEFNAFEYISAARTHLGMSREEAEQLTMTEFQMLLAAKFPEQNGFTKEEYDAVADDYLARKAKRLSKVKNVA